MTESRRTRKMKSSQSQHDEIEGNEDSPQMTTNPDDSAHEHPPVGVPPTDVGDSVKDMEQKDVHHPEGGPPEEQSGGGPTKGQFEGGPQHVQSIDGPQEVRSEVGPPLVQPEGGPQHVQSIDGPQEVRSEVGPLQGQSEGGSPHVQPESLVSQTPGTSEHTHAQSPSDEPQAFIKAPAHLIAPARSNSPHLTNGEPQDGNHPTDHMQGQAPGHSTQPMYTQASGHPTELRRPQDSGHAQHVHPNDQGNPRQGHPQAPNHPPQVRPPATHYPPHWRHQAPYYSAQQHPQMNGYPPQGHPPPPAYPPQRYPQAPVYPPARGYLPMQMVILTSEQRARSGSAVWIKSLLALVCIILLLIVLPRYV